MTGLGSMFATFVIEGVRSIPVCRSQFTVTVTVIHLKSVS